MLEGIKWTAAAWNSAAGALWQIPAEFYLAILNLELSLAHQSLILLQNKYLLCAPRAKMIHPSKPTDCEWRQTVRIRRRITCMHLLSHSDGINQKGLQWRERYVETIYPPAAFLSFKSMELEFVILLDKRTSTAGRLIGRTNAINSFREMRPGLRSEGSSQRSGSASLWRRLLDAFLSLSYRAWIHPAGLDAL